MSTETATVGMRSLKCLPAATQHCQCFLRDTDCTIAFDRTSLERKTGRAGPSSSHLKNGPTPDLAGGDIPARDYSQANFNAHKTRAFEP